MNLYLSCCKIPMPVDPEKTPAVNSFDPKHIPRSSSFPKGPEHKIFDLSFARSRKFLIHSSELFVQDSILRSEKRRGFIECHDSDNHHLYNKKICFNEDILFHTFFKHSQKDAQNICQVLCQDFREMTSPEANSLIMIRGK